MKLLVHINRRGSRRASARSTMALGAHRYVEDQALKQALDNQSVSTRLRRRAP